MTHFKWSVVKKLLKELLILGVTIERNIFCPLVDAQVFKISAFHINVRLFFQLWFLVILTNILAFSECLALPAKLTFKNCGLFLLEMWIFFHFMCMVLCHYKLKKACMQKLFSNFWATFFYSVRFFLSIVFGNENDSFNGYNIFNVLWFLSTGMFGSGVLSYFALLRWLFLLNIVILLLTIFFLFIPQAIRDISMNKNNASFTGWELLTGEV